MELFKTYIKKRRFKKHVFNAYSTLFNNTRDDYEPYRIVPNRTESYRTKPNRAVPNRTALYSM